MAAVFFAVKINHLISRASITLHAMVSEVLEDNFFYGKKQLLL